MMTREKEYRIGQGIDVHPLVEGRKFILGGVDIPNNKGLLGHSDADVLTHALIDALLGASGRGDIGTYFPPTDLKWKDARSMELLKLVWSEVSVEGWKVVNIDCCVMLEAPRLNPYIDKIKYTICEVLGMEISRCGVKAGSNEKLGFVGRGEGVMASVVVLLERG